MSIWSWIKRKLFPSSAAKETRHSFTATSLNELVFGTDFGITEYIDAQNNVWARINILRGPYTDVSFKFNKLRFIEENEDEGGAKMEMDYDFISTPTIKMQDTLAKSQDFNNFILNIAFTLILLQLDNNTNKENDTADGDTGRDDLGEPDSE